MKTIPQRIAYSKRRYGFQKFLPRFRSGNQARKGAAIVETAFALPIFMMAILGIVEFGRGMMVSQLLQHASREGARRAVLQNETNTSVEGAVDTYLGDVLGLTPGQVDVEVTITADPNNSTSGNDITVSEPRDLIHVAVSVDYSDITFIPGRWLQASKLRAHSTMRKE